MSARITHAVVTKSANGGRIDTHSSGSRRPGVVRRCEIAVGKRSMKSIAANMDASADRSELGPPSGWRRSTQAASVTAAKSSMYRNAETGIMLV